jgi:hypothetical protein
MSIRKAKLGLRELKEVVASNRRLGPFLRIEGETEGEALAPHGITEWPEDARFIHLSRADMAL